MTRYHVRYVHKIAPRDTDTLDCVELPDGAPSDRKTLAKALRDAKVLLHGTRLNAFRVEGDKIVAFPAASSWHSVILTVLP